MAVRVCPVVGDNASAERVAAFSVKVLHKQRWRESEDKGEEERSSCRERKYEQIKK